MAKVSVSRTSGSLYLNYLIQLLNALWITPIPFRPWYIYGIILRHMYWNCSGDMVKAYLRMRAHRLTPFAIISLRSEFTLFSDISSSFNFWDPSCEAYTHSQRPRHGSERWSHVTTKMICRNTPFTRAGKKITRSYKWNGATVVVDRPMKMHF